jgi:two-component system CheB/CheR fusion protein
MKSALSRSKDWRRRVEETQAAEGERIESGHGRDDFHIVGIGASAGGLEPLERLFSRLPSDTGMAFVVVQHLSPDFKSLMSELLARRTSMPVRTAEHEMAVEPNSVYLIPPTKEMRIKQRRLLLQDKDPKQGLALPIDMFLRSLAQDAGERSVAVILSGSGSDGSRGIQEIRRAGGTVFCESPETAQFNGMPVSAINTGMVDQVLPAEDIAPAIAALGRPSVADEVRPATPPDAGGVAVLRLLRDEYGIDFSHYKASTVTRRIERRLALNRSVDLEMYAAQLRSDPRELSSLYEDLLIGVTRFFRDDAAFGILESKVIPEIVERAHGDEQIRVWVPGCATGQEPYSIAMLLHEQLASQRRPINVKILATDVHKSSLEFASAGVYNELQLSGVSPERVKRFFTLKSDGYHIAQALRESIVFAPHNLIRDAPFTKLDLVACRNLLIYFQPHAQQTVLTLFHFCLKPGGFLFLGSSETPGSMLDEFDTIDEHAKVYRKRRDIALPRDLKLPLARGTTLPRAAVNALSRTPHVQPQLLAAYDRLLDRFMPPSFLVDAEGALVDSFGGVSPMLRIRERRPTTQLVDMLNEELKAVVSGALHRIRRNPEMVTCEDVGVPGVDTPFTVTAEPIRVPQGSISHVLITFTPQGAAPPARLPGSVNSDSGVGTSTYVRAGSGGAAQMESLEEELTYTKQNLQAAIEELEATNEELQATNEELIASNEELQSTNEELHSVNEELYTVNAEYQKKNAELQELNNDIEHLLNGTDVATIFLDRQLSIRKFTPRIAQTFDLLPQDLGRSIRSFSHDLTHPSLIRDLERVLQDGTSIETQTFDSQKRCYFLRILPYHARGKDGASAESARPDGVVLTLIDISALEEARAEVAQLSAIVESSDDAIVGCSLQGVISSWNSGATRLYGYASNEAVGRHMSFLQPLEHREQLESMLTQVRQGRPAERFETKGLRKDGALLDVSITLSPILDGTSGAVGMSAIARDISPLVRGRFDVAEREERIRLLLDSTAEAIYGIDLNGSCTFCNQACARLLGYDSPASLIGRQMHPLVHHTRADGTPYPAEQSSIYDAMRHRQEAHVDDEVLWRADGTSFPAEYWSHPIYRDGEVLGAVVTFIDITERRRAEQEIQEGSRRREQFLAMLSHELRNPLAAILSATRVIESGTDDRIRQEAGLVVERQAKHMARLLDDLLDVARITRGRIVLRNERLDLRDATRSAVEALQPFLNDHNTRLELDIDPEPIPVVGDAARLQQIQANLLSNAAKYSPPGSLVKLEVKRDGDHALIRVCDNGRGIEREMLPRIFDLFVQGDKSLDRSGSGLGIGLTLLRSLVQLHNGTVEAHSDGPDCGSVFTIRLPLAKASMTAADNPAGTAVRTVVVVEDQPDARRMMELLLESMGVRVFSAGNGKEGAELITRVQPDLALVDLGLPVMSGYDLARKVRQEVDGHPVKLVALSGYGQDADVKAAIDAGFDEHITKPPDPRQLEQLLTGIRAN